MIIKLNKIPFVKSHANGNDFILLQADSFPKKFRKTNYLKHLCDRNYGIGADGLFIISSSDNYDFFIDYYNSDGTWETLCANGSRCVAQFMYKEGLVKKNMLFETGDGIHSASVLDNELISMSMNPPQYKSDCISPKGYEGYFVDTGARHFVCESNELSDKFVYSCGNKIRYAKMFQPHGINVNFYRLIRKNTIEIKTYEKGIERVMLSCASGATAVVYHLSKLDLIKSPTITKSTGGNLTFSFNNNWTNSIVTGPAEIVFRGKFY